MHHLVPRRAAWPRPPRSRWPAVLLTLIAAAAFTAAAPTAGASAQAATAGAAVPSHFTWTATPANISGDSTYINNFATNNQPGAIVFITPDWDQGGVCPCVYDTAPTGVWYDTMEGRWAIFNENQSAMPAGASFNVLVVPQAGSSVFVQTATAANTSSYSTYINSPLTNGVRGARLMVTPVWNPGTRVGVYNNHAVGVSYISGLPQSRWAIFNEDKALMPRGASFNVMVGTAGSGGGTSAVQAATSANTHGDSTFISNPATNGSPNTVVFETPSLNPSGVGGTYDTAPAGIWWSSGAGEAAAFNENRAPMPVGAAFNLIIYPSSHFVWTATPGNVSGDSTFISNFATNNQPGAIVFITPNWNQGGVCGCLSDPSPVGVWFDTGNGRWAIFNENQSAMPAGASFNILVVPAGSPGVFVQTATTANTNGDYTTIESGYTDDQPNRVLMVTPVYNPGGAGGTYNGHAVGVYFNADVFGGQWAIFNEDRAAMPAGASFNVMVDAIGSDGGISTGQLATSANTSGDSTFIDDPRTNGDPNAVVFDTPNLSPYLSTCGDITDPCAFDPSPNGLWWSAGGGEAAVFNEDQSPMPLNAPFNLIIYQS